MMSQTYLFFIKEIKEAWKTRKILIILIVFTILGILSPLLAMLLPEILASSLPEGVVFDLPEPTSIDSWSQYFNNLIQIGLLVLVILFNGIVSSEVEKGTLITLLARGLSRKSIILGKYLSMVFLWTISLLLTFFVTFIYTGIYFPDHESHNILLASTWLWLFGLFLFSVVLFGSTFSRNHFFGLLFTSGVVGIGLIANVFQQIEIYNPFSLASKNMEIIIDTLTVADYLPAIILNCTLTILLVYLSVKIFEKKLV